MSGIRIAGGDSSDNGHVGPPKPRPTLEQLHAWEHQVELLAVAAAVAQQWNQLHLAEDLLDLTRGIIQFMDGPG